MFFGFEKSTFRKGYFLIYIIIAVLRWWAFSLAQCWHNSVLETNADFGCVYSFTYPLQIFAYCFVCSKFCLLMSYQLVCYVWTRGKVAGILYHVMGILIKAEGVCSIVLKVAWKIAFQCELQRRQYPVWWGDSAGFYKDQFQRVRSAHAAFTLLVKKWESAF